MERLHVPAVPAAPRGARPLDRMPAADPYALPQLLGNRGMATLARRDPDQKVTDPDSKRGVRRIQMNGVKGGFTDMAMVILPEAMPPDGGAMEVLLFMHGHHVRGAHGYEKQDGKEGDDLAFHKIPQQLAAAGRPMVAILPQGGHTSQFGPGGAKGFNADAYIASVFAQLTSMKAWGTDKAISPGGVVLAGHSGADVGIGQMLDGDLGPKQLEAVFLFDTMWPDAGHEEKIWGAIERRLNGDLTKLAEIHNAGSDPAAIAQAQVAWVQAKGFRLYDTFVSGGTYDKESNHLRRSKEEWLRRSHVEAVIGKEGSPVFAAIARNLAVAAGTGPHDFIVGKDDHLKQAVGMLPPTQTPGPAPTGGAKP